MFPVKQADQTAEVIDDWIPPGSGACFDGSLNTAAQISRRNIVARAGGSSRRRPSPTSCCEVSFAKARPEPDFK